MKAMMKHPWKSAASLLLVLVMTLSGPLALAYVTQADIDATQSEIDTIEDQKAQLREEQAAIQTTIDSLEAEQASVVEQKAALDQQNELARQEIELINEQIDIYDQLIESKSEELEEAIETEQDQMQRYLTRMRAMEEGGTASYLSILFQATSFNDLLSRVDMIREVMEYDSMLEDEYIASRQTVEVVKAEYEATQADQEETRVELEEKKAELEASIEEASAMIASLEDDIEAYEAYYAEKEAAEAAIDAELTSLLQELQRQEQEMEEQERAKTVIGTGSYIWPLPGYTPGSRTFGYRMHPILGVMKYHSGQDIGAPSGTPIIAADSGSVVVAISNGWGGGYGNYVMINHGDGRATLYAHMSSVAVSQGQTVSQGQIIGYVGSTGLSTGPHLHFEVRVNGSAVDPLQYFSNYG